MKLCEIADVISNLGSDLELLESIKRELLTSKVESETERTEQTLKAPNHCPDYL